MKVRIGNGFDVHRFRRHEEEGAAIMLGGVRIPHQRRLIAHSDGDVAIHALCDAMLGALALGDIGKHFPDTDPAYAGMDSAELLRRVHDLVAAQGWQLCNADLTIIAEAPRVAPHVYPMREKLASLLGTTTAQVSVKATTAEGLGFAGRGEGIACMASVLLSDSP